MLYEIMLAVLVMFFWLGLVYSILFLHSKISQIKQDLQALEAKIVTKIDTKI